MTSMAAFNAEPLIGTQVGTSTIMKVLPKSLITPKSAELFQQEAEAVAILSHPNIIPVYEVGETDDFLFITMQLIQGNALSQYLQAAKKNPIPSKRTLPLAATLRVITQVLDALDYAHRQHIVHRDIKPGNILVEKDSRRPLLTDFGIVKVLNADTEATTVVHGTPIYMAPEQILGMEVDGRTDIYAAGTMLFQMLATDLPLPAFKKKTDLLKHKIMSKDDVFLKKPSEVNPAVDSEMDRIIQKATAFDPSRRYATCREFLNDLETYEKQRSA